MERNKISLEHLYNPAKLGVGKLYDNPLEGFEHPAWYNQEEIKMSYFFNNCKIEDCVFLLTKSVLKLFVRMVFGVLVLTLLVEGIARYKLITSNNKLMKEEKMNLIGVSSMNMNV